MYKEISNFQKKVVQVDVKGLRATTSFDQTLDLCPEKRPKILLLFSVSISKFDIRVCADSTTVRQVGPSLNIFVVVSAKLLFRGRRNKGQQWQTIKPSGHGEFTNPSLQIEAKARELKSFTFSKDLKSKDTSVRES
uniref:Uncharacterized protein n=1 Tax=Brassica oleracea var. oleracea TaxID=109376 RepID=A0A0D3BTW2_BRAOL